jgi:hypothetical protein
LDFRFKNLDLLRFIRVIWPYTAPHPSISMNHHFDREKTKIKSIKLIVNMTKFGQWSILYWSNTTFFNVFAFSARQIFGLKPFHSRKHFTFKQVCGTSTFTNGAKIQILRTIFLQNFMCLGKNVQIPPILNFEYATLFKVHHLA